MVLAALALAGTTITILGGGIVWVARYSIRNYRESQQEASRDLKEHTKAAVELKTYLKDRNGRDAEIHKELMKEMKEIPIAVRELADRNLKAHQNIRTPVKVQTVETQVVKEQRVKDI